MKTLKEKIVRIDDHEWFHMAVSESGWQKAIHIDDPIKVGDYMIIKEYCIPVSTGVTISFSTKDK